MRKKFSPHKKNTEKKRNKNFEILKDKKTKLIHNFKHQKKEVSNRAYF
jgi:hypothetical protein